MNYKRRKPHNKNKIEAKHVWCFKKSFKKDYLDKKDFKARLKLKLPPRGE